MGPQNGIMGDENFGTQLEQNNDELDQARNEMANAAKFSKTKEFKELKKHLESRIEFYQTYLPDGRPVVSQDDLEQQKGMWLVANTIISEFKAVISAYEQAAELIKASTKK